MSSVKLTGVGVTDPSPANNTATNDTPIGTYPPADIIVGVNSTPNPAPQGSPVSYDVRVTNAGPSTATGAMISLDVPPGSTLQSFDNSATGWACTAVLTKVSCTYAQSFPPGTLPPVVITVLPDPLASSINVTAQGSGRGIIDSNPGNNTAAEIDPIGGTPPVADLVLTVTTAPTEPRRNLPVVYTLDIANKGPGAATGAVLTYNIPSGGTVQSIVAPDGWSCAQRTNPSQVSCWYNGTIAANSSALGVQITIVPGSGTGQLDTQATVTPKGAVESNAADNTVATTTALANYKLDGGGFGCSAVPGGGVPAAGAGLLGTLLGLLGLLRRRR